MSFRTETHGTETRGAFEKNQRNEIWFFERVPEISKPLIKVSKIKRDPKTPVSGIKGRISLQILKLL
jgi:hypothetical protein